uniref:Uncharacterized protein n=1 Tax=viral metagenome TaxID=1070528 RepID=A0A6M3KFH6_9ZZZZ
MASRAGFAVVNQRGEITTFELPIKVASSDYGINVFEVRYAAQDSCDWMNENL